MELTHTATEATGATALVWLLIALPLAGFAVNILFGRALRVASGWLATAAVAAAFAVAVAAFADLQGLSSDTRAVVLHGPEWFAGVSLDLRLDPLSAVLALVITGVGGAIHLYSVGYMAHDERPGTYFAYLNLFVAAMLTLVLGQSFLVTFLGWEGVGLCSYLLIGFWYSRREVPAAAKKAFVVNRVGDVGFLLAMFILLATVGSLDYGEVLGRVDELSPGTVLAVALLLLLACAGKSAQLPLFVWLPDAMAGPTPVSALIHAATMVTAGVFLVLRAAPVFTASTAAQTAVVLVGALTALTAALIASAQDDIKRILAFSTISQLGYMFIAVGLGPVGYAAGIFHLVTHAFFKAQLFLGAGSVMHANDDDTDVKHFGGLWTAMPLTWATTLVAWLAILGVPPLAGYFSKEQILAAAAGAGGVGTFALVLGVVTAGLTAFYMSRLFFLTFHGRRRWPHGRHPHESPPVMTVPLVLLAAGAAVGGLINLGHHGWLYEWLHPLFAGLPGEDTEAAGGALLPVLTVAVTVAAAVAAWVLYGSGRVDWLALRGRYAGTWALLSNKLYVDELYEAFTVTGGRALTSALAWLDRRGIDGAVNELGAAALAAAEGGRRVQTGQVRTYAVGVLGGAVLLVVLLIVPAIR